MQQRNLGKQMWELFSPILVYFIVGVVVETIVFCVYYFLKMPAHIDTIQTMEDFMKVYMDMVEEVLQYSTEIAALSAACTIPVFIWMTRRDARKEAALGIVQNKKAPLTKYVLVAGISIPLSLGLNNLILLSNLAEYSEAYQKAAETLYMPSLPVQILCVGIVIPIMEEYLFRGLIFKRIRRYTPARYAILFSAVFFGVYHGNLVQMIYGTICGVLLAWLYEKYGSIKAPILAHILMNIVVCIMKEADAFTWMFSKTMRMAAITVGCAALASIMFLLIQKIEETEPET